MSEFLLLSASLVFIGAITLTLALKFLRDEEYAKKYIKTSPKAFIWRKIFGEEKAYAVTKKFFAPLGIVLSSVLILIGLFGLYVSIFISK